MGQTKVVPQGIQNEIQIDVRAILKESYDLFTRFHYDVNENGNLVVQDYDPDGNELGKYEIITVIIPAQANYNTEVRNG
jgi:hypothetical protein